MRDIHKEKCKQLKKIRKSMADKLGIDLQQRECTFEGKCSGTCPKCKQEEELLNKAILQKTAVAGVIATMGVGLVGCVPQQEKTNTLLDDLKSLEQRDIEKEDALSGDVEIIEPEPDYDDIVGGLEYIESEDEFNELEGDVRIIEDYEDEEFDDFNERALNPDALTGLVAPNDKRFN